MAPLSAAVLLLASLAAAEGGVQQRLDGAAALSQAGAGASDPAAAKNAADAAMDGGSPGGDVVAGRDGTVRKGIPLRKPSAAALKPGRDVPPAAKEDEEPSKLSTGLMLGGAAALGGLQGWFTAGVVGAAAGAGLGLAAAWLFSKKDYGGAFGLTAGAIVGTALGGPLGGLIGAAVGGIVGHFLGKLFL